MTHKPIARQYSWKDGHGNGQWLGKKIRWIFIAIDMFHYKSLLGPGLETIVTVGKLTEIYRTVHLKEFTDFPKKDEKDPTEVFTDIHFEKKSVAHEAQPGMITSSYHMPVDSITELHPLVEGHLMDARVQGE